MTGRSIVVALCAGLILVGAYVVYREHRAAADCAALGLLYDGAGCRPDPRGIILQRDLRRT